MRRQNPAPPPSTPRDDGAPAGGLQPPSPGERAGEARREAAIHEAAHAVIARWHGLAVHAVSIDRVPGRYGMAVHHDPRHGLGGSPGEALHAAVVAAEVSYAGEFAVQAYLGRAGCGNEEDIAQIAEALQRVCHSREQLLLMARWVGQRVRDRLQLAAVRAAILAVAEELESKGTLDRVAFEEVVTRSGMHA